MSFVPNYPLILLPERIKANLANKPRRAAPRSKPKKNLEFEPTLEVNSKLVRLKETVAILRYLGWFISGVIGITLCADLFRGASFSELLPGMILMLLKTLLMTGVVHWVNKLDLAKKADLRQQRERYWQANQQANQNYHEQLLDLVQQEFKDANPHLRLRQRKKQEPLDNHCFKRGIIKEEAQKGVSEKHFLGFLTQYFSDCEIVCDYFSLDESIGYTSDFSLVTPDGKLGINIEIDEPYDGKSKTPHHCTDDDKDRNRNNYFLQRGWVVLRLSEYQVVHTPESCCRLIATLLEKLGYDAYLRPLIMFDRLPKDPTWTSASTRGMVATKYREMYLDKAGIFKYDAAKEKYNANKRAKANKSTSKRSSKPKYRLKLQKKT